MSEFKNLTLDVADGIAVLAISRPAALNALNSETLDELNVCLSEIEANDDIKAVILTGGPDKKGNEFKSFVAGADIAEMVNFTAPEARAFGIKATEPFFNLVEDVRSLWHVISVSQAITQSSDSQSVVLESSLDLVEHRDLPVW